MFYLVLRKDKCCRKKCCAGPSIFSELNALSVLKCILDNVDFSKCSTKGAGCRPIPPSGTLINEDMQLQAPQTGLTGWVPAAAATCCCWIPKAVSRAGDGRVCKQGKKRRWTKEKTIARAGVCVRVCLQFKIYYRCPQTWISLQACTGLSWWRTLSRSQGKNCLTEWQKKVSVTPLVMGNIVLFKFDTIFKIFGRYCDVHTDFYRSFYIFSLNKKLKITRHVAITTQSCYFFPANIEIINKCIKCNDT